MDFEWDEVKSEACFSGRGFDFAYVARAFYDPDRVIQEDARHSYGEERYQLLGKIEQRVFVVIYTPRRGPSASSRHAKPTNVRLIAMKTVRVRIDPAVPESLTSGRIDTARVDATTEADIARQAAADEAAAMQDAAKFVRRVRKRLGLSQAEFSKKIDVPLESIRNWEQGKRCPTGAAKSLLKVLDKAPEAALAALH
ncbi:BrnT family toxin [Ectothiorhodospira sp. BSL-9]|uniref:BrnT family toxin n=2 Tax=Ectothiorhodospira sp. BSL-9 TaxID=1442136 RepID=UPI000A9ED200|nr:BrnT family toxin [Ectothiorhodospira sp. BSL-9]